MDLLKGLQLNEIVIPFPTTDTSVTSISSRWNGRVSNFKFFTINLSANKSFRGKQFWKLGGELHSIKNSERMKKDYAGEHIKICLQLR